MFCCRLACHDTLGSTTVPQGEAGVVYLLFIWNMFCCRLACHDTLEVPEYHRGGGGSVFVVYLEHVLLSTCLPRHSRSTTVPQGEAGVVYLLFIWNMFCCRLACHDTLEVPQYHRVGRGVVTLPPSRGGGVPWTSNSAPYMGNITCLTYYAAQITHPSTSRAVLNGIHVFGVKPRNQSEASSRQEASTNWPEMDPS